MPKPHKPLQEGPLICRIALILCWAVLTGVCTSTLRMEGVIEEGVIEEGVIEEGVIEEGVIKERYNQDTWSFGASTTEQQEAMVQWDTRRTGTTVRDGTRTADRDGTGTADRDGTGTADRDGTGTTDLDVTKSADWDELQPDLQTEAKTLQIEAQTLQIEAQTLQTEAQTLQTEAQTLQTEAQTLQTEAQTLQTEAQTLQTEAQTLQTEAQTLQTEAQTLQTEAQTLQTEAQTLQTEAQTLQTEAQTLQTEAQTLQTEAQTLQTQTEADMGTTRGRTLSADTGLVCVPVLSPKRGSFFVEGGNGVSVGSVLSFWCREGFQLVGSDHIQCNVRDGLAKWSNYPPVCEAIPRPQDRGLRVAVLVSVVSGVVILAMSLSFLICCIQDRTSRLQTTRGDRLRRREKHSSRRSAAWEGEEGEWESFPPPKIFHLSQRMNPRLAPDSPLYLTGASGFENRGYQRSQESLLKAPGPGLYRSESQLYPHVVLQRVATPTAPPSAPPSAPLYLHLPQSSSAQPISLQPRVTSQYPAPPYPSPPPLYPSPNPAYPTPAPVYPSLNPDPQRPWQ